MKELFRLASDVPITYYCRVNNDNHLGRQALTDRALSFAITSGVIPPSMPMIVNANSPWWNKSENFREGRGEG